VALSQSFDYIQGMVLMAHSEFSNVRAMHPLSIAFYITILYLTLIQYCDVERYT